MMYNAHTPALHFLDESSAHCKQFNAFMNDCHEYIKDSEFECKDIVKIYLLAITGSSKTQNGVSRADFLQTF